MRKPLTTAEMDALQMEEKIQLFGANARARYESVHSNPYRQGPAQEGLSQEEWTRRGDLWELGWTMEDLMR